MKAQQVIQIIVYVCRAIQIPVALIALGLTASLLTTFSDLTGDCTTSLSGILCNKLSETRGGLRFSISTVVLAVVDVSLGLFSIWRPVIPAWLILTFDSVTAGFYFGSGSSIAAKLNGDLCDAGPSDPNFACGRLYADMGFMFVGAMSSYGLVACFWTLRAKRCKHRDVEVESRDSHALENPFQDPANTVAEEDSEPNRQNVGHGLSKRKSWSERT